MSARFGTLHLVVPLLNCTTSSRRLNGQIQKSTKFKYNSLTVMYGCLFVVNIHVVPVL